MNEIRPHIPKNWNEITIDQYIQLNSIEYEKFHSTFYLWLEKLAIITNTQSDDEVWEYMDLSELKTIIDESKYLNSKPSSTYKKLLNDKYRFIEFNKLTLGQFIDLEYFFSNGLLSNLTKILAILYPRYKYDEWDNILIEPYGSINLDLRKDEFNEVSIQDVFGVFDAYVTYRKEFMSKYEKLFEPEFDDDEQEYLDEEIQNDPILLKEIEEEKKLEEIYNKWSWENLLYNLSNGDLVKINEITDLPLIYVFNFMALKRDLNL